MKMYMNFAIFNSSQEWRHSYFANYWIYDVANNSISRLTKTKSDNADSAHLGNGKISLAIWSPTGHNVAWVRDNDIFATLENGKEIRITNDGSKNVINGIADWVYEGTVSIRIPHCLHRGNLFVERRHVVLRGRN